MRLGQKVRAVGSNWPEYTIGQFAEPLMPEELPTAPVKTRIQMTEPPSITDGFEKFSFGEEVVL